MQQHARRSHHRNYLSFCASSGIHGSPVYGKMVLSLWSQPTSFDPCDTTISNLAPSPRDMSLFCCFAHAIFKWPIDEKLFLNIVIGDKGET